MDEKKKSFWTSAPGILTGIAALITAIVGLLGVLHQIGYIGGGPLTLQERPGPPLDKPQAPPESSTRQKASEPELPTQAHRHEFHLVSQGQEILKGSYTLDLDAGVIGGATADADLYWHILSDDTYYLETYNSAELSLLGATDLSRVPNDTFLTASFAPARLNGSPTVANQIPAGTVILVKTNAGRYAKVHIEQYGIAAPGDPPQWPKRALLIRWETFTLDEKS